MFQMRGGGGGGGVSKALWMRLKECNIGWEGHPLSFIKKRETPFSDETSIIFCHKTSSSIYFCDFYPNKRRLHALRMVHYIVCAPPTAIMLQLLPSMMMTMMIIRRKKRTCFFLIMIALIAVAIWMMELWPRECVHPSKSYYATATALNSFLYMHICFVICPFIFFIWHYG